jgi:hypothetical protein
MLFREIVVVYYEDHTKLSRTLYENAESMNVKAGATYSYHCTLNGYAKNWPKFVLLPYAFARSWHRSLDQKLAVGPMPFPCVGHSPPHIKPTLLSYSVRSLRIWRSCLLPWRRRWLPNTCLACAVRKRQWHVAFCGKRSNAIAYNIAYQSLFQEHLASNLLKYWLGQWCFRSYFHLLARTPEILPNIFNTTS